MLVVASEQVGEPVSIPAPDCKGMPDEVKVVMKWDRPAAQYRDRNAGEQGGQTEEDGNNCSYPHKSPLSRDNYDGHVSLRAMRPTITVRMGRYTRPAPLRYNTIQVECQPVLLGPGAVLSPAGSVGGLFSASAPVAGITTKAIGRRSRPSLLRVNLIQPSSGEVPAL